MTRTEILNALAREHQCFLDAISGLGDDEMIHARVAGELTVKDLLGHVAMWMQVAVKFIADYRADRVPKSLGLKDDAALNAYNAQGWDARRGSPLARVRAEFDAAYRDLIASVESLSDEQLNAQLPAPWGEGDTLERLIAVNSYEHEPEHTEQIYSWRAKERAHES